MSTEVGQPAGLLFSPTYEHNEAACERPRRPGLRVRQRPDALCQRRDLLQPGLRRQSRNLLGGLGSPSSPKKAISSRPASNTSQPSWTRCSPPRSSTSSSRTCSTRPRPSVNPFAQQQLGEVTSRGFEFEGKANITENLKVLASFTAFDLETTKDTRPAYVGKTPIIVPEVTASLWLDYTVTEGCSRRQASAAACAMSAVLGRQREYAEGSGRDRSSMPRSATRATIGASRSTSPTSSTRNTSRLPGLLRLRLWRCPHRHVVRPL